MPRPDGATDPGQSACVGVGLADLEEFGSRMRGVHVPLEKAAQQGGSYRPADQDAYRHHHDKQDDHEDRAEHARSLPSRA